MEDKRNNLRRHINAARDWLQEADKSIERKEDVKGDLKIMLAKAELKNAEKHQNKTRLTKILSFVTAAVIALAVIFVNGKTEPVMETAAKNSVEASVTSDETVQKKQSEVVSSVLLKEGGEDKENVDVSLNEDAAAIKLDSLDSAYAGVVNKPQIPLPEPKQNTYVDTSATPAVLDYNPATSTEIVNKAEEGDLSTDIVSERGYEPAQQSYVEPRQYEYTAENSNFNEELERASTIPSEPDILVDASAPTQDMQKLMQSAGQILRAE